MTIAALKGHGITGIDEAAADPQLGNTGLFFAFDSGYVEPFKVMLASMARNGGVNHLPIFIATDDPAVFDDPIVRAATDHKVLIEGVMQEELYDLAKTSVERQERNKWHKGTFLKWVVFDNYPVDQMLFLDVDMLCLKPFKPLIADSPAADMVVCPQFQRRAIKFNANGKQAEPAEIQARLQRLLDGAFDSDHNRLNSGVMLIRKRLLSTAFREDLVKFARTRTDKNEQGHLTQMFRQFGYQRKLISSTWNFQENYLPLVDEEHANQLLDQISILHYAGGAKPWVPTAERAPSKSWGLWRIYQTHTASMGLLGS